MGLGNNNTGGGGGGNTVNNITQIVEADPCGINEYIHNLKPYKLYFAHENQFSTLTTNVNGVPSTYENLLNSNPGANPGQLNFNSGGNGNFNKRANTVESISKIGDYFEIISGSEALYDTIVIALSADSVQANTASSDYRLFIRSSGYQLYNKQNELVFTQGQEAGTYRFTRTLYGFEVSKNGAVVYNSPEVCTDYEGIQDEMISSEVSDFQGSLDIGEIRMQWGRVADTGSSTLTVTLPKPFADDKYTVTPTGELTARIANISGHTATSFVMARTVTSNGDPSASAFRWFAVGKKPTV